MRAPLWLAIVLAAVLTAGCIGGVDAAGISEDSLEANGWEESDTSQESVAFGLGEIVTKDYRPKTSAGASGAIVATVTDVPLLDESRFLPRAIEQVADERNMQMREAGTDTIELNVLGIEVEGDVYEFEKDGINGQAIVFTPGDECESFVVGVGYGVTGGAGFAANAVTYEEARRMVSDLEC